ncbi:MAG: C39 family peptidase [Verrucomicrobiales bacterium]|nr:C39 family peptidase [Verrucomicrobiales bacterium]
MKRLMLLLLLLLATPRAEAIPNSFFGNGIGIPIIPAFPRFNADLTEDFLTIDNWKRQGFPGPWRDEPALEGETVRRMEALPLVFGEVPMSVMTSGDESGVSEITLGFLDAGLYFGYHFGGEQTREQREAGRDKRQEFERHFEELVERLGERLEEGCGRGTPGVMGVTPLLRTEYVDYVWEDFVLRLIARPEHSVSLHLFKRGGAPASYVESEFAALDRRARAARFASAVLRNEAGEVSVQGIPMFVQGETPFCGINSLAMASRYLGLRASPVDLAGSAGFKNTGSAGGSNLIGLYRAVGDELGMRTSIVPTFDRDKVLKSLEDGLPVIVWRRVSMEREKVHQQFAAERRQDPALAPPALTAEDLAKLPERDGRGLPSHASVVTGYSTATNSVIYAEPWGEDTRDRRMRVEELEATAYAVVFFKL